jgi:mannitol/fructose-specific phosphotransferase system IIA component (Ntr-type)
MVRIVDYLSPERVVYLKGKTKQEALLELVDAIGKAPEVSDKEQLRKAIFAREEIMSTGIGLEIAVPHAKLPSISNFVLAVGISKDGIEYDSLDGKPVKIVVMIAGPAGDQELYLRILASVTLLLKNARTRDRIISATTPAEVRNTFAATTENASS